MPLCRSYLSDKLVWSRRSNDNSPDPSSPFLYHDTLVREAIAYSKDEWIYDELGPGYRLNGFYVIDWYPKNRDGTK
jgi:hypothetical protein